MKWLTRSTVGAAVLVSALAMPATSLAKVYGVAEWFNTATHQEGGRMTTTISPVGAADWSSGGHVNQTIWVGTNGATQLQDWVELGYTKGFEGANVLTFYWADQRPNGGGYHEHQITSVDANVGDTHKLWIVYIGNDKWNVNIGATNVATSVANPDPSHSLDVLPQEVGGAGDWWPAAECAVGSLLVVVA
jgi:hypothetical protein